MILIITGVPGTGKSTLAEALSRKKGWELLKVNELLEEKKLWLKKEKGAKVANMRALARVIGQKIKGKKDIVLEGHLLCDMKLRADAVAVLRTNPKALRKRLEKRGYPKDKINENVMAEALDYCTIEAESRYKKVYEIDTTRDFSDSLLKLERIANGKGKKFAAGKINWAKELEEEVKGKK